MLELAMQVPTPDPLIMRLYYNIPQSTVVVKFLATWSLSCKIISELGKCACIWFI